MSGRRFVWRWSARLFRLEWRQHGIIVALIGLGVALGVGALVAVFNVASPPGASYGTGQLRVSVLGDHAAVRSELVDQGHRFGLIETATVQVPGTTTRISVRAQDPDDVVTGPQLALLTGRWPADDGEVAITEGTARELGLDGPGIGQTIEVGAGQGPPVMITVIGQVENPTDLGDEFALVPQLGHLGVAPAEVASAFLVDARPDELHLGPAGAISVESTDTGLPVDTRTALTLLVNVVTAVALLEVALLAGAGFAVMARRRSRQLGLLGAIGATPAHLRGAATASGVLVGLVGSAAGAIVGVGLAALVVPRLEEAAGHRIDLTVPWWTVVPTVALAVLAAGLSARWPSRALADQPVATALAAGRPRSGPVGRLALAGVILAPAGVGLLLAGTVRLSIGLAIAGVLLALVGVLLLAPAAIRGVAGVARAFPLAGRLAARSLDRQRGRSAAVVAALVLALGLPVGLAAVTGAIDRQRADDLPNLAEHMTVAWVPGAEDQLIEIPADADTTGASTAIAGLTEALPTVTAAPIEVAVDPDRSPFSTELGDLGLVPSVMPAFGVIALDEPCMVCDTYGFGDGDDVVYTGHDAWVATPELLGALDLVPPAGTDGSKGLTRLADVRLVDDRLASGPSGLALVDDYPALDTIAPVLILPDEVEARGWQTRTIGWLLNDPSGSLTARADEVVEALGSSLLVETRVEPEPSTALRATGLLVGGLTGMAILVAAVALELAEGARDRRILAAIGAAPGTVRRLAVAGAVILASTGALLAVPTGYLAPVALLAVPGLDLPLVVAWVALAVVFVGFPAVAGAIGWFGGGLGVGGDAVAASPVVGPWRRLSTTLRPGWGR